GLLGTKNFKLIGGTNPLGQDWNDEKNLDDFMVNEIVLPKDRWVRVRITAKDVLHNFYLPQFRVKMDAVPGLPTYFVFKPIKTTEEYRQELSTVPEYQVPDPNDPEKMLWETFNYELACAELCGKGHFSMRRPVRIVEQAEYEAWTRSQNSLYFSSIRGTDEDPYLNRLFDSEIRERKAELNTKVETALAADAETDKVVRLDYVYFETGSAQLTELSRYELDNVAEIMGKYPNMQIELGGHTDSQGDDDSNLRLSEQRAQAVYDYLVNKGVAADRMMAVGYGETKPVDSNDTEDGRANNRRTEFTITAQ
ncbi:MAG: OmpA family protein, partial [Lewinella sp.]|nr:OmpA family protein [Lewinella sp.]